MTKRLWDDNYQLGQYALAAGLLLAFATGTVVMGAVLTGKFPPKNKDNAHERG